MLNEDLAPFAHDDTDYAIRCIENGYINGVYAVKFNSEVKWGGTRQKPHPTIAAIQLRNIEAIKEKYKSAIKDICDSNYEQPVVTTLVSTNFAGESDALRNFLILQKENKINDEHNMSLNLIVRVRRKLTNVLSNLKKNR